MPEAGFHFEQPIWFLGLLALAPVAWWFWRTAVRADHGPVHRYADAHLMPYLTGTRQLKTGERLGRFIFWATLWVLMLTAMAGPRWSYVDVRLFHPGNNLLILLDISRSMAATDVNPSRLGRARQEIQDLITRNRRVRLGLIAFASVPHVISPVTEDLRTLLNALPALSTDLPKLQGSRLGMALDRAQILIDALPEDSARSLLLISDGDFDEPDLEERIRELAKQGVRLHVLGIGSDGKGTVPGRAGGPLVDRYGMPIMTALNEDQLKALAKAGGGTYQRADYRDSDTDRILDAAAISRLPPDAGDERTRIWENRYYLPLAIMVLMFLWRMRGAGRIGGRS